MKKNVLTLIMLVSMASISWSQTTVLDFEGPSTTTTFQYFGSALDGSLTSVIANPNPSTINTSAMVTEYVKPDDAQTWAGAFTNPDPNVPVDLTSMTQVCVKVHMDHIGNVVLKLENSGTGDNWEQLQQTTTMNEWEEICFDTTLPSDAAPNTSAAGNIYPRIVLFFDLGTDGAGSAATSYFDDIVINPSEQVCSTVLDFEGPSTTTTFQYFGSALDGSLTSVIANPNPSGINTSANVTEYVKPDDAQVWAGAFSNPDPTALIDLTSNTQVCIKVHMDHIGNLALKLENSTSGGDNWLTTQSNTMMNAWEELCFDVSLPSEEDPFTAAAGNIYTRVVLFFDFGTDGAGSAATSYFDDICLLGGGSSGPADITFSVDMNEYSGSFTSVYVSGTFNGWSGTDNPLSDPDTDGVYTGTVTIPTGAHEYKFTVDDWAAQEEFGGLEECTVTDPSGQFINRSLIVSENKELSAVCFNSCYACGNSAIITFQLGMGAVVPDTGGVYLAGGGNFESPGGRFLMNDDDMDNIYTISFEREKGFSSFYTFANGNCPDFSCKEDISGQSCADPNNFNDRLLPPVTQDTVIATCFGLCATNTDCTVGTKDINIVNDLFTVSPNPVNDLTTITFVSNAEEDRLLKVYDIRGQLIFTAILDNYSGQYELNTASFHSGIYLITVQEGNNLASRKIIKR